MTREREAAVTTMPEPAASPASQPAAGRRPMPWWRLRTWRRDLDALTKLRDGLQAMDFAEEAAACAPADRSAAGSDRSAAEPDQAAADSGRTAASAAAAGELLADGAEASVSGGAAPSRDRTAAGPRRLAAGAAAPEGGAAAAASPPAAAQAAATPVPDPAIVAIRETFGYVAAAGDDAVAYFYAWLFLRRPELRELFPPAMDEQRDRLFRSLGRIVESMSTPDEMARYLSQLGRDHRKYGVEPEMYDAVGEALIATLRTFAGEAFTSEAEEIWTQTYTAASALMIRSAEEDAALAPAAWTAEVVQIERRGRDIAVVTIAPDRVLPYAAGQHLTLQTRRWRNVWRPYSVACMPRDDGLLSLHVKAVPGGWVSSALVHHTDVGDELTLGPAMGTMTLAAAAGRDLLCVAGGTGLAPVKAIIEQAVREQAAVPRRIFVFYGARHRDDLYDLKDLWRLSDACPGLQLTPVTSDDPAFEGMQGNVGRVAARYLPHADCEAYVAGPADMVRETIRVLGRAGLARGRIHYDDLLLAGRPRVGTGT